MSNQDFRITAIRRQNGIVTTFTGVLVLVLLTLMMFFAIRVGVFEQRVSSNEMRQKHAFHAAESGLHHAKEFFRANSVLAASYAEALLPDGSHGWLAETDEKRWASCAEWAAAAGVDLETDQGSHPCFGESVPAVRGDLFFYSFDGSTAVPVDTDAILPGTAEEVDVQALLCVLEVDETAEIPVQGCTTDPDIADGDHFMITLLARGQVDCGGGVCNAEALVSEQISNFGAGAGGRAPSVPLVTKNTFPPSGTAEVVPNPNAGGVGVPISVWMNANPGCIGEGEVIEVSSSSWATCEMHEWYQIDLMPDDYACPWATCSCSQDESISYTLSGIDQLGIDMVADPLFPCDLFQFYFGVPRANYEIVKGYARIIDDCTTLGPNSFGIFWAMGAECRINANTQVGSPDAPVLLISAASNTLVNGGAKIYGTLFVTDVEDSAAELNANGTNTVYGSVIVDSTVGLYTGTFQVVWNENTSRLAGGTGGLGTVVGGWSDFHRDWTFE
jgi:hypothetical protein